MNFHLRSSDDMHRIADDLKQAVHHLRNGQLQKAERICERLQVRHRNLAEPLHVRGLIAHRSGDYDSAAAYLQRAIRLDPHQPLYYGSLGNLLSDQKEWLASIACYQKAVRLDPNAFAFYYNMGNGFHVLRKFAEAVTCYEKALSIKPDLVEARYNLANTRLDQGKLEDAICHYQKVLALEPEHVQAHFNLAIAYFEKKDYSSALAGYQKAVALNPNLVAAHYNMGLVFQKIRRFDQAIACYQQALTIQPDFVEALNNLGLCLYENGRIADSIRCLAKTLQCNPNYVEAYYNIGKAFHDFGHQTAAIDWYRQALERNPRHHKACNNIGKAYQDILEIDKAITWYQRASELQADYAEAQFNLATARLLTGNLKDGWPGYEWRFMRRDWKRTYPHQHDAPRWQGESFVAKKLLVHSEQGIGDTLQFVRYLPLVKARGGTVLFETRQSLLRLLRHFESIDELLELDPNHKAPVKIDLHVPLLSLPGIFQTALDTIPDHVPYIFADPSSIGIWQQRFKPQGLKVGLVWAGNDTDPKRSCHFDNLLPLFRIPGISLYGLQKGPAARQIRWNQLQTGTHFQNFADALEDFSDTAAAVHHLDLVVSIDTSVAHLAGAMGKPVWLMLPFCPDWRWLLDRSDSPWYPTMELFRQPRPGDWQAVVQAVVLKLKSLAAAA